MGTNEKIATTKSAEDNGNTENGIIATAETRKKTEMQKNLNLYTLWCAAGKSGILGNKTGTCYNKKLQN